MENEVRSASVISRRSVLRGLCATVAALSGACQPRERRAPAGACPQLAGRRIRWIVPRSSGGGFDAESRLIKPFYESRLGAEIVVENMPGAGGIVGSRAISNARPDGLTLGIVNAPGLLVASLLGETAAPDPSKDFTVLGRVARSWQVWAVGARTPFQNVEGLLAEAERRPIVFAVNELGGTSVVGISAGSWLLGVNHEMVPGFEGSRGASLAVLRGEVDCVCYNFDTILDLVESGDLKPILQVSDRPVLAHPSLEGVPLLGGAGGWAARRAGQLGREETESIEVAEVLTDLIGAGRVVVAPPRLEDEMFRCLERGLYEVLTSAELKAAARRALDVSGGEEAAAGIREAAAKAGLLLPHVRESVRKSRG